MVKRLFNMHKLTWLYRYSETKWNWLPIYSDY